MKIICDDLVVDNVIGFIGGLWVNSGMMFIIFKLCDECSEMV